MVICPILYGAAITAQATMQAARGWGFNEVGNGEGNQGLLHESQCKREKCQWWGTWTWSEETEDGDFYRLAATGCTYGQIHSIQKDGNRRY
jgi:hypothetical protein